MNAHEEFMQLGVHCSLPACNQLDFLPFKCPCCSKQFCQDHWHPSERPSDHDHVCAAFDPVKADNRIPSCPLCSAPITFKPGTDPNIPMDAHFSTTCPILHPSLAKKKGPKAANICASKGCKTKMIVPIRCTACGRNHCPQHRFEKDHACAGKPVPAVTGAGGRGKGATPQAGTGKTSLSGLAALRRAQTKVAAKITPSTPANTVIIISDSEPSSDSDIEIISPRPAASKTANTDNKGVKALASVGVGRKVDKRALAEQESQRRGLEARAKKGLLSEDEKVRYATLQALDAKKGNRGGKDGCVTS